MSEIAELRALEEFLMEEESHGKDVMSHGKDDPIISDEEADKFIEKIKGLSIYEEMSDDDDDDKKNVDEEKKSVWITFTEKMSSKFNNIRAYLTSK